MKTWKKQLYVVLLLQSDSSVPKSLIKCTKMLVQGQGKAQMFYPSLYLRTSAMIQKTHLLLTALTTDVTNTLASGFIYRRPASWGRRERKTNKQTNQQNQQPLSLPKAISHLFGYGESCSARLEQNVQQTQNFFLCLQKALGARAAHSVWINANTGIIARGRLNQIFAPKLQKP